MDLLWCTTDCCRRGHDLRMYVPSSLLAATQRVYRAFVHSDHRPERTRNQMELVLDDQSRWRIRRADAEQRASLRVPRQQGELVNRADHHTGSLGVDRFVHHKEW